MWVIIIMGLQGLGLSDPKASSMGMFRVLHGHDGLGGARDHIYQEDDALRYIAYVMLIWARLIPSTR